MGKAGIPSRMEVGTRVFQDYLDGATEDRGHEWVQTSYKTRSSRYGPAIWADQSSAEALISLAHPNASSSTFDLGYSRSDSPELSSAPPSPRLSIPGPSNHQQAGSFGGMTNAQPYDLLGPQSLELVVVESGEVDGTDEVDEGAALAHLKRAWRRQEEGVHKRHIAELKGQLKESEGRERAQKRKIDVHAGGTTTRLR